MNVKSILEKIGFLTVKRFIIGEKPSTEDNRREYNNLKDEIEAIVIQVKGRVVNLPPTEKPDPLEKKNIPVMSEFEKLIQRMHDDYENVFKTPLPDWAKDKLRLLLID